MPADGGILIDDGARTMVTMVESNSEGHVSVGTTVDCCIVPCCRRNDRPSFDF
jgi:hypothetical protein